MNKAELIAAVAAAAEISKKDAETAVSATLDAITAALKEGDKVLCDDGTTYEITDLRLWEEPEPLPACLLYTSDAADEL